MGLKILEFETKNNKYIFDGVSGTVFAVDEVMMDCIKAFDEMDEHCVEAKLNEKFADSIRVKAAIAFVKKMKEIGLFYNENEEIRKLKGGIDFDVDIVNQIVQLGYMQQLILNVTEDCNMRCRYCYLSEAYQYTRNRTDAMMSIATAKKSLDYFFDWMEKFSKFNPGKKCAITFYGGEPLINFDTIRFAIEYTKRNSPVGYRFNLTTNGLLLDEAIADFLVQNDVIITVSLDGYKDAHDRNRLDAGRNGTFNRVIDNIVKFKKKYPQYLNINLSCVYDYKTDLLKIDTFFKENEQLLPYVGNISLVFPSGTNYFEQFTQDDIGHFVDSYVQFRQKFIDGKIMGEKLTSFMENFWGMQLVSSIIRYGVDDPKLPVLPFTGACVPGMKMSIRPDGKIDICEKVNGTFAIGDIDTGLDIKVIAEIMQNYNKHVTKDCAGCPIYKQCPVCYAQCSKDNAFFKPNCSEILLSYKTNLTILYTILEYNPGAFDQFVYRDEWVLNA